MDELFDLHNIADPGTLYQVKEFFHHRSVKKNVMANMQCLGPTAGKQLKSGIWLCDSSF